MTKVWVTRDGRKIPYKKLEDGHLLAILLMWIRHASAQVGLKCATVLLEGWPEEAHDEQDEIFERNWRSVEAPSWFKDLHALARKRGLDLKSLEEEGAKIQELVETNTLITARIPCGDCRQDRKALDGVPDDYPIEGGLAGLIQRTLEKKDPLNERDLDLVRMVLARAIAQSSEPTTKDSRL